MAEDISCKRPADGGDPVDIETAIAMIEAGDADDKLCVDLGQKSVAYADGRLGLQGLLQRLRGHRMLTLMAKADGQSGVISMRSGKPGMHPDVASILDALKHDA